MDPDHGAQSQRRSPLAKKRARCCEQLHCCCGSASSEPHRYYPPQRQLEVNGPAQFGSPEACPFQSGTLLVGLNGASLQPTPRSKVCRRIRLEQSREATQPSHDHHRREGNYSYAIERRRSTPQSRQQQEKMQGASTKLGSFSKILSFQTN